LRIVKIAEGNVPILGLTDTTFQPDTEAESRGEETVRFKALKMPSGTVMVA